MRGVAMAIIGWTLIWLDIYIVRSLRDPLNGFNDDDRRTYRALAMPILSIWFLATLFVIITGA